MVDFVRLFLSSSSIYRNADSSLRVGLFHLIGGYTQGSGGAGADQVIYFLTIEKSRGGKILFPRQEVHNVPAFSTNNFVKDIFFDVDTELPSSIFVTLEAWDLEREDGSIRRLDNPESRTFNYTGQTISDLVSVTSVQTQLSNGSYTQDLNGDRNYKFDVNYTINDLNGVPVGTKIDMFVRFTRTNGELTNLLQIRKTLFSQSGIIPVLISDSGSLNTLPDDIMRAEVFFWLRDTAIAISPTVGIELGLVVEQPVFIRMVFSDATPISGEIQSVSFVLSSEDAGLLNSWWAEFHFNNPDPKQNLIKDFEGVANDTLDLLTLQQAQNELLAMLNITESQPEPRIDMITQKLINVLLRDDILSGEIELTTTDSFDPFFLNRTIFNFIQIKNASGFVINIIENQTIFTSLPQKRVLPFSILAQGNKTLKIESVVWDSSKNEFSPILILTVLDSSEPIPLPSSDMVTQDLTDGKLEDDIVSVNVTLVSTSNFDPFFFNQKLQHIIQVIDQIGQVIHLLANEVIFTSIGQEKRFSFSRSAKGNKNLRIEAFLWDADQKAFTPIDTLQVFDTTPEPEPEPTLKTSGGFITFLDNSSRIDFIILDSDVPLIENLLSVNRAIMTITSFGTEALATFTFSQLRDQIVAIAGEPTPEQNVRFTVSYIDNTSKEYVLTIEDRELIRVFEDASVDNRWQVVNPQLVSLPITADASQVLADITLKLSQLPPDEPEPEPTPGDGLSDNQKIGIGVAALTGLVIAGFALSRKK